MDTNKDGRVTEDEFFAVIPDNEEGRALWQHDDANSDGVLAWEEFTGPKGAKPAVVSNGQTKQLYQQQQQQQQQQPQRRNTNANANANANANGQQADVFSILDKDHDGLVSYVEYFSTLVETSGNRELYNKEDKNQDGYIEWEEFDGPKSATPPADRRSVADVRKAVLDENEDPKMASVLERQEIATQQSYSREYQRLLAKRLRAAQDIFERRVIEAEEANDTEAVVRDRAILERILAGEDYLFDYDPRPSNVFNVLDANADGGITKEEMMQNFHTNGRPYIEGKFEGADPDGDGVITWEEFPGEKGSEKPPTVDVIVDKRGRDGTLAPRYMTIAWLKERYLVYGRSPRCRGAPASLLNSMFTL